MLIIEGLGQQVSDTVEEEGITYSIGYIAGDVLGGKGLDKLLKVAKVKVLRRGEAAEDIGSAAKAAVKSADEIGDGVGDVGDATYRGAGKVISEVDRSKLNGWKYAPEESLYLKYKDVFDNPKYYNQITGEIERPLNDGFLSSPIR